MNRREWLLGSAAAATPMAAKSELWPCINQQTTLDATFEAECEAWAAAGFRHVELWFPKLRKLNLGPPEISRRLRDAGLTPISACSSDGRLSRPKDDFEAHLPEFQANLELAQALGVSRYVVTSSIGPELNPDDYKLAAERLAQIASLASTHKVRIALEFLAFSKLLGCLPTALSVLRAAAHPNAGICLDAFHFFAGPSKTQDLADVKPGEIAHVHFHDAPRSIPRERLTDRDRLPPGEGWFQLNAITAMLRRIGYRGALSVELFGAEFHTGDPKVVAQRCYRAVRKYTA